ncbi:hypothetical protein MACJ_002238 [Theileria orientalis]|uniref:Uncharacterized protein n=1 Tax=Theileria orientalis TaxID=68886 RepID=A0A976QQF5_THEOR|nr:hypothetical protein MACJ_002238 [Theileria orientalis]
MYLCVLFICNIVLIDSFIINSNNVCVRAHVDKHVSNTVNNGKKRINLYSKDEEKEEKKENEGESEKIGQKRVESQTSAEDDNELVEFFANPDQKDEASGIRLKISRRLWKIINGILAYRTKYGNYKIENNFVFKRGEEGYLSKYKLGKKLNILLKLLYLQNRNHTLYKKIRGGLKNKNIDFLDTDLSEAPKLLWLLGFPVKTYFEESKIYRKVSSREDLISNKMGRMVKNREMGNRSEDVGKELTPDLMDRVQKVKESILENMLQFKKRVKDAMVFSNPQELPEPSNKAEPVPGLIRKIVKEIMSRNTATCPLIKRDTRYETEGGYHYAFFHWSFEQVIQALVMFNDMYFDYNKQLLISSEESGEEFKPITFNILKRSYRIPETEEWPKEFQGMPLGLFIDMLRNGDVDAKDHWLRRPLLDHIGFNWGDGLKYLSFTWDKLELGLIWYVNFRGFPVSQIPPTLVIPKTTLPAKFGKPEEIQGLKLGRLFYSAVDQIQVIYKYYPDRFQFIKDMGLDVLLRTQIKLGYRPVPHSKLNKVDSSLMVSKDERYLFDDFNEPPSNMKKGITNILDTE